MNDREKPRAPKSTTLYRRWAPFLWILCAALGLLLAVLGFMRCSHWHPPRADVNRAEDARLAAEPGTLVGGDPFAPSGELVLGGLLAVCLLGVVACSIQIRRAEQAMRRQRDRAQQYLDIAAVILLALDADGRITLLNRAGHRILGYNDGDLVGRSWLDTCLPAEAREQVQRVFEALLAGDTESAGYVENAVLTRWGRERIIAWHNSVLTDEAGRIIGTLSSGEDITQRKRAEQELNGAKRAAEAANRAKSEFLANMSHEIRTPMTAILGFTDVLLGNLKAPEDLEAVETIRRNGDHLLEIINDILDLSKIEAGKLEVRRAACSPCRILADVASLMRVRADAKGLPLTVEFAGPIPETIHTDPTRLRQILINLVGNAIKFTETGQVRAVVSLARETRHGPQLQFDVIDSGIGMDPPQMERLFQPFTQADSSHSRKYGGTGLGLTISKRLAGMLGGDIRVQSVRGTGSTFSLAIATGPLDGVEILDSPHEALVDRRQPSDRAAAGLEVRLDCRILLAEDGPDNQRLIAFVLRKAGADVTIAQNGKEAMEMALATFSGWGRRWYDPNVPFDMILMDMQMPVMDGYEATRRIRAEGYTGPIIALTAHAMSHQVQKCLDAGCDAHVAKPIDRCGLLSLIARHLESSRRQAGHPVGADRPSDD